MRYSRFFIGAFLLVPLVGHGYFEDRYRCTLHDKSIEVSLSTGEQLCLTYLAGIWDITRQTRNDIDQATKNLKQSRDKAYRSGVLLELQKEYSVLTQTQQDMLSAVKDFEQELFIRVKRVVGYYLKPKYDILTNKLQQAHEAQDRLLILWNAEQYAFVRGELDRREREIMFLEAIRDSGSFDQLIPLVKWRMQLQEWGIEL